jgi:ATP-dependent helicase STH1/SNF2
MEDYLRWKGMTYLRMDGHTKSDERTIMLTKFNSADDPPFIFLLSTRAGGLGLNLQTADTVIIYDSDWNPHQDLQAQDRAHRIGQKKEVRILRMVTSKSVEETILARAQQKLDIDGKVIQAGKFDNKTTDREREELLRSLFGAEDEDEDDKKVDREGEIDDEELNQIIARTDEELELFTKMDEERRNAEEESWRNFGGQGPVPPRLMPDNELPDIFLKDLTVEEQPKEEEIFGRGARSRKSITYDDDGAADDLLSGVEDGDLDGFMARKQQKQAEMKARKAKRAADHQRRRAAGEDFDSDEDDEYQDYDDDPLELPDPEPEFEAVTPRAPKRVAEVEMSTKKKRKTKKSFAGVDPDMEEQLEPGTRDHLTQVFMECYRAVELCEVEIDGYEFFM